MAVLIVTDAADLFLLSGATVLLPEIQTDLGFGPATALRLSCALLATTVASKVVLGAVIQWVGGQRFLVLSLAGLTASILGLGAARSTEQAALCLGLIGICHGPIFSAQALVVKGAFPRPEGMFRVLGVTSRSAAFLTGLTYSGLLRLVGWRPALELSAVLGLFAMAAAWCGLPGPGEDGGSPDAQTRPPWPKTGAPFRQKWLGSRAGGVAVALPSLVPSTAKAAAEYEGRLEAAEAEAAEAEVERGEQRESGGGAAEAQQHYVLPTLGPEGLEASPGASAPPPASVSQRLRQLGGQAWFRWGLLASIGVNSVCQMYPLLSLFFYDTCSGLRQEDTALLSSSIPLGMLLSNLGPGKVYAERARSWAAKKRLLSGLLLGSLAACAGLVATGGASEGWGAVAVKALLACGVGLGLGVAWYIPLSSASALLAPHGDAALCQSLFDASGTAGATATQLAAAQILAHFAAPEGRGARNATAADVGGEPSAGLGDDAGGEAPDSAALGPAWRAIWALCTLLAASSLLAFRRFYDACAEAEEQRRRSPGGDGGYSPGLHRFDGGGEPLGEEEPGPAAGALAGALAVGAPPPSPMGAARGMGPELVSSGMAPLVVVVECPHEALEAALGPGGLGKIQEKKVN